MRRPSFFFSYAAEFPHTARKWRVSVGLALGLADGAALVGLALGDRDGRALGLALGPRVVGLLLGAADEHVPRTSAGVVGAGVGAGVVGAGVRT